MIITFIGHSTLSSDKNLTQKLLKTIKDNIQGEEQVSFYCGGYGDFDNLCAATCQKIKMDFSSCEIVYVTPYFSPNHQHKIGRLIDSKLYDKSIYPPIESVPLRLAILKRNEWMISSADLIIACVYHSFGGAYKSLQFALRKKKRVID